MTDDLELAEIKRRMATGERLTPIDPAKGLAITMLERRCLELEAECASAGLMETALAQADHRLAELGDTELHPVRKAINAALNTYAPVME